MALRKKKDGGFIVGSEQAAAEALERRNEIAVDLEKLEAQLAKTKLQQRINALTEEDAALDVAVREFVLKKYEPGDGFEGGGWKFTKVQGHTRRWNPDVLSKLLPRGIFKNVVKLEVVPAKIDEYVRSGKINLDDVEGAYEETATNPYVKVSKTATANGGAEADALAEKLA